MNDDLMSQLTEASLETYALVRNAKATFCVVCGQDNCRSSDWCRKCSAPMALTIQSLGQPIRPQMISVLGAEGAGKTTYLGMLLEMLLRHEGGNFQAKLRGALAISMQQEAINSLAGGRFPNKSSELPEHWRWAHCLFECKRKKKLIELFFSDIAGKAQEAEADNPGAVPALQGVLARSEGTLLLIDAERAQAGDHSQDHILLKLLSQLSEYYEYRPKKKSLWKSKFDQRPVAILFTKADRCEGCLEEPERFARGHASMILRDCQNRFPQVNVFSCSVTGASAYRSSRNTQEHIPLRIEPQGLVEPVGWLVQQLASK